MATPKRRMEPPAADEEDFLPVRRKRPKQREAPSTTDHGSSYPWWRIESHREASAFRAFVVLQKDHNIVLRGDVSRTGDILLRGTDWATSTTLEEVASSQPRGLVLVRQQATRKCVLLGYPSTLPLDPVLEHPAVAAAERCTHNAGHGRRIPTRQVLVTLRGHVPASLDLGCWGRFTCRPYIAEPVRCFRCQAFGHFQRQCSRKQELCGVCSGDHASRDCIRRLRDGGERPAARCPNCGDGHHAWNRRCPARLRRIPGRPPAPQEAARPTPRPPTTYQPPHPLPSDHPVTQRERPPTAAQPPPPLPSDHPVAQRKRPPPPLPSDHPVARRKRRRRRRKPRTRRCSTPLPPPQEAAMEVEASQAPKEIAVVPEVLPATERQPPCTAAPRREQTTQTAAGTYTFREVDLVNLLVTYEHLLDQEYWAIYDSVPHATVLSLARKAIREGKPLPMTLPTSRPLNHHSVFYDHVGEQEWVSYEDKVSTEEMEHPDNEDLLLNVSRDLTDEEMARLLS